MIMRIFSLLQTPDAVAEWGKKFFHCHGILSLEAQELSYFSCSLKLMKRTATGRIPFWRNGSLWIGLAGESTDFHAHHAVQITLPFPRSCVRFRKPAECRVSYTAALVEAVQSHAFEARAQLGAQIFVEPESHDGRQLKAHFCDEGIVALPSRVLDQQIAELAIAYEDRIRHLFMLESGVSFRSYVL